MRTNLTNTIDLLIITPIYFRDAGGASIYYRMLVKMLTQSGSTISIVSDKETGTFSGRFYNIFPKRAARNRTVLKDYLSYGYQNLLYPHILAVINRERPETVLIHSSFHNTPGLFSIVFAIIRKLNPGVRYVADVRDRLLPPGKVKSLDRYDSIIACSENVKKHLVNNGLNIKKIELVPVLQEPIIISDEEIRITADFFQLSNKKYIIYVGAVKEEKAVDLLLRAYIDYIRPLIPELEFVIVGLLKTNSSKVKTLLKVEGVRYIGSLERQQTLALMKGAVLCVNISPCEGMPRVSLEALALRRPTLLPPNVPEFMFHCPDFVMNSQDPNKISNKIIDMIQNHRVPNYPIEQHFPEQVLPHYVRILGIQ